MNKLQSLTALMLLALLLACGEASDRSEPSQVKAVAVPNGSHSTVNNNTESARPLVLPAFESKWENRFRGKMDTTDDLTTFKNDHPELYGITLPPQKPVTVVGEFEATAELFFVWDIFQFEGEWYDFFPNYSLELIRAAVEVVKVNLLHSGEAEKTYLEQALQDAAVDTTNIAFVDVAATPYYVWYDLFGDGSNAGWDDAIDSPWLGDYGPTFVRDADQNLSGIDPRHYLFRLNDDTIGTKLANQLAINAYRPDVIFEGSNLLTDGAGLCVTSTMVQDDNFNLSVQELETLFGEYYGCKKIVWLQPLEGEYSGHVDMFMTFVAPKVVLVGQYTTNQDSVNAQVLDENAQTLQATTNVAGESLTVVRIPMPNNNTGEACTTDDDCSSYGWSCNQGFCRIWRTYTNVTLVNGTTGLALVPVYATETSNEAAALQVYADNLAGWTVKPIASDSIIVYGGAVHRTTRTLPEGNLTAMEDPPAYKCEGASKCPITGDKATGSECAAGSECQGALCLPPEAGFTGGYCSQECDSETCLDGSECMLVYDQYVWCLQLCDLAGTDCRAEYECFDADLDSGQGICVPTEQTPEDCGNGVDDDGDGQTDCDDDDCTNSPACGGTLLPTGQACTEAAQCEGNRCVTDSPETFPEGYCSQDCQTSADCTSGDSVCVTNATGDFAMCADTCALGGADCRQGYTCIDIGMGDNQGICWPSGEPVEDCTNGVDDDGDGQTDCDDADCANTAACGGVQNPTGGECTEDAGCEGEMCLDEATYELPGGYCTELCSADEACTSGDGVCVQVGDALTLCMDVCNLQQPDCRQGYTCVDIGMGDGYGICWLTGEPVEDCYNGEDDDGDGLVDCNDEDCANSPNCGGQLSPTGQPCTEDAQCEGEVCFLDEWGFPDGYCTQICQAVACVGDAICIQTPTDSGDIYWCADLCEIGSNECRTGYECYDVGVGENKGICVPIEGEQEDCANGTDDDGDGQTDCDDPDCAGADNCVGITEDCGNGTDDDGDGNVDCDDTDCATAVNCLAPQEDCSNGIDDDGDLAADCQDSDCANEPHCIETPEENCTNQVDDDGDSKIDCQDSDCATHPACISVPENCTNQMDDDGDGKADCDDADCASHPACAAACMNECAAGDRGCSSDQTASWSCQQDANGCWKIVSTPCADGQTCVAGVCQGQEFCQDECQAGDKGCGAIASQYWECANIDQDECLEKAYYSCPPGQTCDAGVCQSTTTTDTTGGADTTGADGISDGTGEGDDGGCSVGHGGNSVPVVGLVLAMLGLLMFWRRREP